MGAESVIITILIVVLGVLLVLGLAVALYMSRITPTEVQGCGEDRPAAVTGLPAAL